MITIYIYKAKDGWRWRIKRKGRIIAESGEGYKRRAACVRTLHRMLESITNTQYKIEGDQNERSAANTTA